MKITRIVATEEGESRFTEFDIPFDNSRQVAEGITVLSSKGVVSPNFRLSEFPQGFDWGGRHSAPTRQLVIILSGVIEVETSDRQTQQWRAGEVFLADDLTGEGHLTRVAQGPVQAAIAPLPAEFVLERWSV
jgi:hypothetical protein